MTKTEIEKAIRKQKPAATFGQVSKSGILYTACIALPEAKTVTFLIPLNEIGDAFFNPHMESQLLIRYLISEE